MLAYVFGKYLEPIFCKNLPQSCNLAEVWIKEITLQVTHKNLLWHFSTQSNNQRQRKEKHYCNFQKHLSIFEWRWPSNIQYKAYCHTVVTTIDILQIACFKGNVNSVWRKVMQSLRTYALDKSKWNFCFYIICAAPIAQKFLFQSHETSKWSLWSRCSKLSYSPVTCNGLTQLVHVYSCGTSRTISLFLVYSYDIFSFIGQQIGKKTVMITTGIKVRTVIWYASIRRPYSKKKQLSAPTVL